MYYANEPTPSFSKVQIANWTPYINDVQLEMNLSELGDEILSIDDK